MNPESLIMSLVAWVKPERVNSALHHPYYQPLDCWHLFQNKPHPCHSML